MFTEKIGTLTRISNTQVQLTGTSIVKLGGQQRVLTSPSLLTDVSGIGGLDTGAIAASSFYYVYAVYNGSATGLVASLSNVSPAGFTRYKKVGAFFTNSVSAVTYVFQSGDGVNVSPGLVSSLTTQGFGVISSVVCSYHITDGVLFFQGRFLSGTATADQARVSIPDSLFINADVGSSIRLLPGRWYRNNSSGSTRKGGCIIVDNPTTYFLLGFDDYTAAINPLDGQTGTAIISPGQTIFFHLEATIIGLPVKADWKDY